VRGDDAGDHDDEGARGSADLNSRTAAEMMKPAITAQ
jgi:hypothetical protein